MLCYENEPKSEPGPKLVLRWVLRTVVMKDGWTVQKRCKLMVLTEDAWSVKKRYGQDALTEKA